MTEGVYRNVGSLAEYWRKLVSAHDNDESAWIELCAQISSGCLVCDPLVTVEQLQEPALRYYRPKMSREPRLTIKSANGAPIDAEYYRATLILAKPSPPEPIAAPSPPQQPETPPDRAKPAREAKEQRKGKGTAAQKADRITELKALLVQAPDLDAAAVAEKFHVSIPTAYRYLESARQDENSQPTG